MSGAPTTTRPPKRFISRTLQRLKWLMHVSKSHSPTANCAHKKQTQCATNLLQHRKPRLPRQTNIVRQKE